MEKEEESWHPTERRNVRGCHFVVDIDAKVQQYLEELRANNNDSNDDTMSDRSSTLSRFTVRGPGQTARDPLQFVSTNHGEKIAEEAKQQVTVIEHQKNLRDKVVLPKFSDDAEPWQSDLDTWRRKRLEQVNSPKKEEVIFPIIKETNNNGYSKSSYSKEKEEILRIASPQTDEHNDSGIENRTSNSPSTSADFSPRSADLISPKSYDEAPNTPPPPPPPQSESAKLDQVLIPLSLESQSSGHVTATRIIRQNSDEDEYYPQISRSRQKSQVQEKAAMFESSSSNGKSEMKASHTAMTSERLIPASREEQVDVTVELVKEQRAAVTASRFPRRESRSPSNERTPYMTYLSHSTSSPHVPATTNGSSRVAKLTTSGTVYRAVDIPFDEKPASYVVKKDDNSYRIHMEMGAQPVHKGWGMTVGNRSGHPTIESVIVGSPADQAGILVGDRILSIEGESVADKYPSAINKQLQAAARIGEIDIKIQRPVRSSSMSALHKDVVSSPTFNKARSIFSETKSTDSYSEFKKRHSRGSRESERNEESSRSSARDYNSLPRNANIRDHSGTSYRNTYESLPRNTQDYRVTSIHDKPTPGKLTDFVPEVERNFRGQSSHRDESLSRRQNGGSDEPRVVRNYDLPPQQTKVTTATINLENSRPNDEYVSSVLTRSTLPRNKQPPEDQYIYDDDTVPGKPLLQKHLRQFVSPSGQDYQRNAESEEVFIRPAPARIVIHDDELQDTVHRRSSSEAQRRRYDSGGHYSIFEEEAKRQQQKLSRSSGDLPRVHIRSKDKSEEREERTEEEAHEKISKMRRSGQNLGVQELSTVDREERISDVTHRFYDKDGNYLKTERRRESPESEGHIVNIERRHREETDASWKHASHDRDASQYQHDSGVYSPYDECTSYRREEYRRELYQPPYSTHYDYDSENRDWREVIREQRQPSPGMTADRHRISQQAASLHNLPTYINRRLEESRNAEREVDGRSYESRSLDRRNETSHSHSPAERYEKTEYSRYEKHYSPNYSTTVNVPGQRTTATYEREVDSHRQHSAEQTPIISSYSNYRNQFKQDEKSYSKSASDQKSTNFIDESARKDGVVAVSGKHKCAHCGDELGRGAAMIIESLNLFYHLGCFKCYVCKTSLGSGATGADVRVREGRLHCQSCYSNDRVQLSKV